MTRSPARKNVCRLPTTRSVAERLKRRRKIIPVPQSSEMCLRRAEARLERALREQKQAIEAGQAAAESAAYSLFQRLNDAHNLLFLQQTQIDLLLGGQAGGAARPGFGGGGRVCESAEVKELKLKHDAEIRELVRLVSASRPRMVDAACGMQEEEKEKCDSA